MRELSMNEILSVNGGAIATYSYDEFAARSTSVPAQYMQAAYSSYLASIPTAAQLKQYAADARAFATFDYGIGLQPFLSKATRTHYARI